MALTPGGGRSPSTQPPPAPPPSGPHRPAREPRPPQPPATRAAATSVLRWGLLIGGLVIIADLGSRVLQQRLTSQEIQNGIDVADWVVNIVLFSFVGVAVMRETAAVYLASLAGLLAGLIDGLVVAASNSMAPRPGVEPVPPEADILQNLLLGMLFATVAALVNRLFLRRPGAGPP